MMAPLKSGAFFISIRTSLVSPCIIKRLEIVFRIAKNNFVPDTGILPVGVQGRSALFAAGEIPDIPFC